MLYDIGDIVKLDDINHQGKIAVIIDKKYNNSFIYVAPYFLYQVLIQGNTEIQWISEETISGKI